MLPISFTLPLPLLLLLFHFSQCSLTKARLQKEASAAATTLATLPICRWCECNPRARTVSCVAVHFPPSPSPTNKGQQTQRVHAPASSLLRLPPWADSVHASNVSGLRGGELPHFADHRTLRELHVKHCGLRSLHPLSFVPLPQLEVVDLQGNELTELPATLFHPLARLRVLNLANNRLVQPAAFLGAAGPGLLAPGLVLDRLVLSGNPFTGTVTRTTVAGPAGGTVTRRLLLARAGLHLVNGTGISFFDSKPADSSVIGTPRPAEGSPVHFVPVQLDFWRGLEALDVGENPGLWVTGDVLPHLRGLHALRLAGAAQLPPELLGWLSTADGGGNSLRHLDLAGGVFAPPTTGQFTFPFEGLGDEQAIDALRHWTHCGPSLQWLDISEVGVASEEVGVPIGEYSQSASSNKMGADYHTKIKEETPPTPPSSGQSEAPEDVGLTYPEALFPIAKRSIRRSQQTNFPPHAHHQDRPLRHRRSNDGSGESASLLKSRGGIESIHLNSVCPIKWLYADRNRIHEVRIDAGNGLLTVSLDENWLTRFPLLALDDDNNGDQPQQSGNRVYPNLQSLSLAGNLLEEVPEELVARFPALQQLDLARNRLTELVLDVSKRDEKDGHQQLRVLNASGNLLGALELAGEGRLDALTVLDLSANRLTRFSLWTLGGWLPAIEHLHLDGNPELAAGGAGGGFDLLPSGGFGSNPLQLPPLVELDLRAVGLRAQPDLAAFHTLRLVDLSENEGLGGGLDGRLLPAQVVQVSARSCALRAVGNFSREQLASLKVLDLAGTPLQCQCPVQPELIDVLRRQPDIYFPIKDEEAYWCTDEAGWRYPLGVFLAVENLVDCIEWTTTESESSEGDNNRWALDMLAALVSVGLAALILLASGLLLLTAATLYLRSSRSNVAGRVRSIIVRSSTGRGRGLSSVRRSRSWRRITTATTTSDPQQQGQQFAYRLVATKNGSSSGKDDPPPSGDECCEEEELTGDEDEEECSIVDL